MSRRPRPRVIGRIGELTRGRGIEHGPISTDCLFQYNGYPGGKDRRLQRRDNVTDAAAPVAHQIQPGRSRKTVDETRAHVAPDRPRVRHTPSIDEWQARWIARKTIRRSSFKSEDVRGEIESCCYAEDGRVRWSKCRGRRRLRQGRVGRA